MSKQSYPTTVPFRELSQTDQTIRLDVAEDLLATLQWWRGDPSLDAWQEGFLTGLVHQLRETKGKCRISEKQWAKIREIQDRMDHPESLDGSADFDGDDV